VLTGPNKAVLFRMVFWQRIETDIGIGSYQMLINHRRHSDTSLNFGFRSQFSENTGIDFRYGWVDGTRLRLDDTEVAFIYLRRPEVLRFGLRRLKAPDISIDGVFAGVSLLY